MSWTRTALVLAFAFCLSPRVAHAQRYATRCPDCANSSKDWVQQLAQWHVFADEASCQNYLQQMRAQHWVMIECQSVDNISSAAQPRHYSKTAIVTFTALVSTGAAAGFAAAQNAAQNADAEANNRQVTQAEKQRQQEKVVTSALAGLTFGVLGGAVLAAGQHLDLAPRWTGVLRHVEITPWEQRVRVGFIVHGSPW